MTELRTNSLCPDDKLASLVVTMGTDEVRANRELDDLLGQYARDPRLHFLKGSLLAGKQDYAAARSAMRRAVDIAPDYVIARFQLGFLLLTSGEPFPAQEAWGPLHALPRDSYIRLFVDGLCHLIRDEFSEAVRSLEEGIARNREILPMNRDMQLIIEEIRNKQSGQDGGRLSSVDMLLQQAAMKATRH